MAKPHASDHEVLLLIESKRDKAKQAMLEVLTGLGQPPHRLPRIETLLEYLSNMLYCVELMLKLLSGNWQTHNVGQMYETAFGKPHPNPDLMRYIQDAIKDQKYLFEPAAGLADVIPDIEGLHDELRKAVRAMYETYSINKVCPLPISFAEYLRDNAARFHTKTTQIYSADNPPGTPMPSMDELRMQAHNELMQIRKALDEVAKTKPTFDFQLHIESMT